MGKYRYINVLVILCFSCPTPPSQVTSDFQARQKFAGAVAGFEFKKGDKGPGYYRTASSNNLHNIATDPTVKKKKKRALAQTKQVGLYDLSNSTLSTFCFFSVCVMPDFVADACLPVHAGLIIHGAARGEGASGAEASAAVCGSGVYFCRRRWNA